MIGRRIPIASEASPGRTPQVVVFSQEGHSFDSFRPGARKFCVEAWRNRAEEFGDEFVSVFDVEPGEDPATWHRRLLECTTSTWVTHIITHIESDPVAEASSWTWDSAWALPSRQWHGVPLGVIFDSAFEWIAATFRLLGLRAPRFIVVDICMSMDGSMVRRPEVGPGSRPTAWCNSGRL